MKWYIDLSTCCGTRRAAEAGRAPNALVVTLVGIQAHQIMARDVVAANSNTALGVNTSVPCIYIYANIPV